MTRSSQYDHTLKQSLTSSSNGLFETLRRFKKELLEKANQIKSAIVDFRDEKRSPKKRKSKG